MKFCFFALSLFSLLTMKAQDLDAFEIANTNMEWLQQKVDHGIVVKSERTILKAEYDKRNDIVYVVTCKGAKEDRRIEGQLSALDLKTGKVMWSRPFHTFDDGFTLIDTIPVVFSSQSSRALNWRTQEELWRVKCQVVSSTSDGRVAIGYAPRYDHQYELMGVDVHSGNALWTKSLVRDQNIGTVKFLSDTAWISHQMGLDYTDIRTGKGFFHKSKLLEEERFTRSKPAGAFVGVFLFGLVGAAIGYIVMPAPAYLNTATAATQTTWSLNDGNFYLLDAKNTYKVDLEGDVVWKTALQSEWKESDRLFVWNDQVFIVKEGYELHSSGYRPKGTAGIQQFDGVNGHQGKQLRFNEPIEDYIVKDSSIVLVLTTRVVELALPDFTLIKETTFEIGKRLKFGFDQIINPPLYILSDGRLLNSETHFEDYMYVLDKDGHTLEFDENFDLSRRLNAQYIFEVDWVINKDQYLVGNGWIKLLIHPDGQEYHPISFSQKTRIGEGFVLDQAEKEILIYPLKQ
jgi:outer membrane protein assembly factor BamB